MPRTGIQDKKYRSYPQRDYQEEQKKHQLEYGKRSHNRDTMTAQRRVTYTRPGRRQEVAEP